MGWGEGRLGPWAALAPQTPACSLANAGWHCREKSCGRFGPSRNHIPVPLGEPAVR
ncbi:unnamed protein product [Nyctereutes procyonoides]|uniref:(raccoon dog) hypothetical protein n=1 Tax=Nyctereutes procyonoides TaxID=34880 RepID=A0A811XTY0_NYCPR|nr:unnamed protein product [Nyctereutes procyonoides]